MKDVIVVGAGAGGLMAAIMAARGGASVQILEKMKLPGRKLLLTGNGRCNLTNLSEDLAQSYHSAAGASLQKCANRLFTSFPAEWTRSFFAEIGVLTHCRGEYVYPASDQSGIVLQALLDEASRLGVKIKYDTPVTALVPDGDIWNVETEGWTYQARKVILAAGGRSAEQTGSSGDGYAFAGQLGLTIVPVVPALTALTIPGKKVAKAAGARTDADVTLTITQENVSSAYHASGQIQWSEDAVSGIVIFQLSRHVSAALANHKKIKAPAQAQLTIDFVPEKSREELLAYLTEQLARRQTAVNPVNDGGKNGGKKAGKSSGKNAGAVSLREMQKLMQSCVPDRIAAMLAEQISPEDIRADVLTELLKAFTLPVSGTRGFAGAQVCAGGVALTEIDPDTMESLHRPGLYFAGEVLDADGPCGGYNLQWAWSTGACAGTSAAVAVQKEDI